MDKQQKVKEFNDELEQLVKKYSLKKVSVYGEVEGEFFGRIGVDAEKNRRLF